MAHQAIYGPAPYSTKKRPLRWRRIHSIIRKQPLGQMGTRRPRQSLTSTSSTGQNKQEFFAESLPTNYPHSKLCYRYSLRSSISTRRRQNSIPRTRIHIQGITTLLETDLTSQMRKTWRPPHKCKRRQLDYPYGTGWYPQAAQSDSQ